MTISSHFVRFALIGAIGTAVHFAILDVLVRLGGVPAVPASMAGAVCGAVTNYLLNHKWNYASAASHFETGPKFFTVVAIGFALNGVLMSIFVDYLGWHYLLAQALTTLLVLFWNFAANHFWTFAKDR